MATSGTIGATIFTVDALLTKAMRRCGLLPESLTPEIAETARDSLFMLLVALSTEGLNLWCVDRKLIPLFVDKCTYVLPVGTTDILNLLFCVPSLVPTTGTSDANSRTASLTELTRIVRCGFKLSSVATAPVTVEMTTDGVNWTTHTTVPVVDLQATGFYNWLAFDPAQTVLGIRVASANALTVDAVVLASSVRETYLAPYNRDDYSNLPNKQMLSAQVTNYFFEKLITPQVSLWPVPSVDTCHLAMYRYRQIQDVGDLVNELEIPPRWFEPVCWHLAMRLAFEVPGVTPDRRKDVIEMANQFSIKAGSSEVDGSPVYISPNIAPYTR